MSRTAKCATPIVLHKNAIVSYREMLLAAGSTRERWDESRLPQRRITP
jgi:hypothetical protein